MIVASNWLRDHLGRTILSDTDIAEALERMGIEVEQIVDSPVLDDHIVVGLVKKVMQHPNADRLRIAQVATGVEDLSIVCGAANLAEDQKVAVAQVGSVLPGGEKITKATLRGVASEGMLCSAKELQVGIDHSGIIELPHDAEIGSKLAELFPSGTRMTVKTPANRPDLQSVHGVAREVSAMTQIE